MTSQSLEQIERELRRDRENPSLHFRKGLLLFKQASYNRAINAFNKAIEICPRKDEYYYFRGRCQYLLNERDRALSSFSRAIRYNRNESKYYYNRILCHFVTDDFGKVDDELKKIRQYCGDSAHSVLFKVAKKYMEKGKGNSALSTMNLCVRAYTNLVGKDNETHADYLFFRSNVMMKVHPYRGSSNSLLDFYKAIELSDDNEKKAKHINERVVSMWLIKRDMIKLRFLLSEITGLDSDHEKLAKDVLKTFNTWFNAKDINDKRLICAAFRFEAIYYLHRLKKTRGDNYLQLTGENRLTFYSYEIIRQNRYRRTNFYTTSHFQAILQELERTIKDEFHTIFNRYGWDVTEAYVALKYSKLYRKRYFKKCFFNAISLHPNATCFKEFEKILIDRTSLRNNSNPETSESTIIEERIRLISDALSNLQNILTITYDNGTTISIPKYLTKGFNNIGYLKTYTKDIDPLVLKKFFFGIDLTIDEIVDYGIDLVKLCVLLKLYGHLFVLCHQVSTSPKFTTKHLLKLFIKCIESLEEESTGEENSDVQTGGNSIIRSDYSILLDEVESQDILDGNNGNEDENVEFKSCFTLSIFNTLISKVEELEGSKTFIRVLYRLGDYMTKLKESRPVYFGDHPQLNVQLYDRSANTLKLVFMETLKELYNSKETSYNLILRIKNSSEDDELKVHKEVLILRSEFFFRMFRFPGREASQDRVVEIEYLNHQSLSYILEMIYLGYSKKIGSEMSLSTLFNLLVHFEMYGEESLKYDIVRKIGKKMNEELLDVNCGYETFVLRMLEIGHYLENLPQDIRSFFLELWMGFSCCRARGNVTVDKLMMFVRYSSETNRVAKEKDAEISELKAKISSLEENRKRERDGKEEDDDDDEEDEEEEDQRSRKRRRTR